jgi:hypothetical protein
VPRGTPADLDVRAPFPGPAARPEARLLRPHMHLGDLGARALACRILVAPRRAPPAPPAGNRLSAPRRAGRTPPPPPFLLAVHTPLDVACKRPGRCLARADSPHLPELTTGPPLSPPSRASPSARGCRQSTTPSFSPRTSIPARGPSRRALPPGTLEWRSRRRCPLARHRGSHPDLQRRRESSPR